ncbi:hypothetical protein AWZ03_005938 [Drosophila navojoa]|uniref:Uncharacterized protein n=1 Tax=Drosophila navojoa TaxID=7232 RepID=A0A484BHX9_DRONA|nr:hypothetical protein AWZ03_005938 [Drosophila navojoa]
MAMGRASSGAWDLGPGAWVLAHNQLPHAQRPSNTTTILIALRPLRSGWGTTFHLFHLLAQPALLFRNKVLAGHSRCPLVPSASLSSFECVISVAIVSTSGHWSLAEPTDRRPPATRISPFPPSQPTLAIAGISLNLKRRHATKA